MELGEYLIRYNRMWNRKYGVDRYNRRQGRIQRAYEHDRKRALNNKDAVAYLLAQQKRNKLIRYAQKLQAKGR